MWFQEICEKCVRKPLRKVCRKYAGMDAGKRKPLMFAAGGVLLLVLVLVMILVVGVSSGKGEHENLETGNVTGDVDVNKTEEADREPSRILMNDGYDLTAGGTRYVFNSKIPASKIKSLTFEENLNNAPLNAWDVSQLADKSVVAWTLADGDLYDLYIASKGKVIAPSDASCLFAKYDSLEEINFNNAFDTTQVETMKYMFAYCSFRSIDLSGFNTEKVNDMSGMFKDCFSLQTLDLSSFDTGQVQDMSSMFAQCISLQELNLGYLNTGNVTDMSQMFCECSDMETIDLGFLDTSQVCDMSAMFKACSGVQELDLGNFNTGRVTTMAEMFSGCSSLHTLNVKNFDTAAVESMKFMFMGCGSLRNLDISSFDGNLAGAEGTQYMFDGADTSTFIGIDDFK